MTAKRRCTAKTKAGKGCKAPPLQDREVCMAHAPADVREAAGWIPDNGFQGRKRNPRVVDVLRERIEADIDKWLKPLEDALTADKVSIVGRGEDAMADVSPDFAIRLRAVADAFDRVYGKPAQTTQITGAGGGPVETVLAVEGMSDEERAAAELLLRKAAERE